jgi:transketolase
LSAIAKGKTDTHKLEAIAVKVRRHIIRMIKEAGSGHPGGSLSCTDMIVALYFGKLKHNPKQPDWPDRDRFILSKGHGCPAWYAILAEAGYFDVKELDTLRKFGSRLQGHPERGRLPGIEVSSGSLGQGLSVGVGMALAGRLDKKDYRVYVMVGCGEIQEGQIWEAAMSASHYKLDNLCAILDNNGFQIGGEIDKIMSPKPIPEKWQAFGWHVIEIDGHNMKQILDAYSKAEKIKGKPTMIVANTIKGKGVSFMEKVADWHGKAPSEEQAQLALADLTS